ncbi:MAG: DsrE family protein [Elusimicrobia bacterium]|nr:DsrE family protein [Elusimicrobiota bacterium]
MNRLGLLAAALFSGLLLFGCAESRERPPKFLIILQAGTESHEGLARALHALLYAKELKEAGYAVTLVFDGAGTGWAEAFRDPKNKLHDRYKGLKNLQVVEEICDFCAGAFKVKGKLKQMSDATLVGEFEGHPSLKKWVAQGYQIIVL